MDMISNSGNVEFVQKQVLNAWNVQITAADKLFTMLTDEQLLNEVATKRNSGVYLLGHLTAVHDALHTLFGLGDKLYPHLENIFIKNPDTSGLEKPPTIELRLNWSEVNKSLSQHFNKFSAADWLQKHTAISDEAFTKEPQRNRLAVLLNRTSHLAYHIGQLTLLKS